MHHLLGRWGFEFLDMCVFWKVILVFVSLMMYVDFFLGLDVQVFWVGPQVLENVGDMYPRFLRWLSKYCLSMPSKRSLQVWQWWLITWLLIMWVFLFFSFCVWGFVFDCGLAFFHFGFFVIFRCLWILDLDMKSMLSVNGLESWMAVKYYFSVVMGGIGIGDWVLAQVQHVYLLRFVP